MTAGDRYPSSPLSPLRLARERAGLTQCALARLIGYHPATVGVAERSTPSVNLAVKAAAVLGVPAAGLIGQGEAKP